MTTTHPAAPPQGVRRAYRDLDGQVAGGVASGLAVHLGLPVLWVRVFFVVATAFGGAGLALYAAFWLLLPGRRPDDEAPGLASARRGGRRPGRLERLGDVGPVVVLGALAIGALFVAQAIFGSGWFLWPLAIGLVGVGLLWRQADEAQRERWLDASGRVDLVRIVVGDGGWASWARLGAGLALLLSSGVLMLVLRGGSVAVIRDVTIALALGLGGLALVVGPWARRLAIELADERSERVRTQERADVAAHLHDSVLQTLALIQKNPADAARLARAQERDLRSWLFEAESQSDTTVAGALRAMAAEIEDAYGVHVDVVAVGDLPMEEAVRPIVQAAREAVTNAAKHADVGRVDVYAELAARSAEVFVRDRGIGFDVGAVAEDRRGVRGSIVDRMERHGGTGEVRSTPGVGTEVRLRLAVGEGER
ncbi:MAG TPA: PspC domain-containing protein [Nocardioides sp.]|nr:PspC domain-containing protein [Nocardioides sp.]